MKKFLALALLLLSLGAWADPYNVDDTFTADTEEGVTLTFRVTDAENNLCSVSGIDKATAGTVTIPESAQGYSVQAIGVHAFMECAELTAVHIPGSVKTIETGAFYGCSKLSAVTLNEGIESIDYQGFYGCSALTSVTLPASMKSIGEGTFYVCSGLISITINSGLESIGRFAFYGCEALTSMVIPNSVTAIGDHACQKCSGLTTVTLPANITTLDDGLFLDCSNLSDITIPSSVTTIGDAAFSGCSSVTSVALPNGLTSIGKYAFSECVGLTSIAIPSTVTSLGEWAFSACENLARASLPSGITEIPKGLFAECVALSSINIPYSVTTIGDQAFFLTSLKSVSLRNAVTTLGASAFNCPYLTTITIPAGVTSIGEECFNTCRALKRVTVLSETPIDITSNTFLADVYDGTLVVPAGTRDLYAAAAGWKEFKTIEEMPAIGSRNLTGQAYRYWFDRDEANIQTGTLESNNLIVDLPTDGLSDWFHILHIQTQDDAGNWSPVISRSFAIVPASTAGSRDLTGQTYRYWFDRDEASMQTGTLESNNLVVNLPTDGLSDWFHILHIQTQDDAGNWSPVISRSFAIVPASTAGSRDLTGQPYQYWFDDNFDAAIEGTMTSNVLQMDLQTGELSDGVHVLHLRVRDDAGNWGPVISRKVSVGGNFGDIVPWGTEEAWTAKYQFQSLEEYQEPVNDASGNTWTELDYDDSSWEELTGPMSGSAPNDGYNYRWEGDDNCFNLRRKFALDEVSLGRYYINLVHDDGVIVYLNGQKIVETPLYGGQNGTYEIPMSAFNVGENLLAIYIIQYGGDRYLDYSISCSPVSAFDINVTSTGNGTVSLVDSDVRGATSTIQAKPQTDVTIAITPDRGNLIQSVILDEVDVTNQLVDGKLTLPNLLADHTLVVTFVSTETMATVILPKGVDEAWQMKYVFTENYDEYTVPANDTEGHSWTDLDYDDSSWQTLTGPIASGERFSVVNYEWPAGYNCLNLRRKFTLENVDIARYIFYIDHDYSTQVYLNGHLIVDNMNMWTGDQYYAYEIPSTYLVQGENILSIWSFQITSGRACLDYSLTSIPLSPSDYAFTDTQGIVYSLDYQNYLAMPSGHTEALPEDITISASLQIDNATWPVFGFMPNALADVSLSSVRVEETTPYAIPANAFSDEVFSSATLIVPPAALDAYKRTAAWSNFDQIVPCVDGTLVPWGYEQPWTARYLFFEHVSDFAEPEVDNDSHVWSDETFDDSNWQTLTGPMANNGQFPVVNHTEMGENSVWLLRSTFHVNHLPMGAVYLNVINDDDIRVYINGQEIYANSGMLVPRSLIHEGDNTIAFYYHVVTPPDYLDYSLTYTGFLPQLGDANNDAAIDLADLVQMVSHITGQTPAHFNTEMADVNADGNVDAADLVALVNVMMGEGTEVGPARVPAYITENVDDRLLAYLTADGRLCFDLQNDTEYTACQLTLSLPAGADIKGIQLAAERSGGHAVATGRLEDGRLVVLIYSAANRTFKGSDGLFLEAVAQTANQGTIEVDDILFVTPKGDVRHFAPLSIDLVNKVQSSKFHVNDSQSPVYDLAGRRVSKTLKKGIYITNGMKKLKVEE